MILNSQSVTNAKSSIRRFLRRPLERRRRHCSDSRSGGGEGRRMPWVQPGPPSLSCSARHITLPVADLGRVSTNSTILGDL